MGFFRVKVTALAEKDLIQIWLSIAENSVADADRFLDLLNSRIDSPANFPDRGPARPDIARGARILIEGNYLIFTASLNPTLKFCVWFMGQWI